MTQEAKQRALEAFNRIVGVYKYHIIDDMEQDEDIVREYIVSQPATPEGWKPIETAPDGTSVLIIVELLGGHFCVPEIAYRNGDYWFHAPGERILSKPDYWMPLPAAPVQEEK